MDPASAPTSRRRLRPGIGTVALLAAVVVSSVGLVSCQSGGGDRVTVYSGRSEQLVGTILDRFEEATGISVDVRYGDSSDLALLITEEGDRSPADVFLSQSPGAVGFLDSKACLLYTSPSPRDGLLSRM